MSKAKEQTSASRGSLRANPGSGLISGRSNPVTVLSSSSPPRRTLSDADEETDDYIGKGKRRARPSKTKKVKLDTSDGHDGTTIMTQSEILSYIGETGDLAIGLLVKDHKDLTSAWKAWLRCSVVAALFTKLDPLIPNAPDAENNRLDPKTARKIASTMYNKMKDVVPKVKRITHLHGVLGGIQAIKNQQDKWEVHVDLKHCPLLFLNARGKFAIEVTEEMRVKLELEENLSQGEMVKEAASLALAAVITSFLASFPASRRTVKPEYLSHPKSDDLAELVEKHETLKRLRVRLTPDWLGTGIKISDFIEAFSTVEHQLAVYRMLRASGCRIPREDFFSLTRQLFLNFHNASQIMMESDESDTEFKVDHIRNEELRALHAFKLKEDSLDPDSPPGEVDESFSENSEDEI